MPGMLVPAELLTGSARMERGGKKAGANPSFEGSAYLHLSVACISISINVAMGTSSVIFPLAFLKRTARVPSGNVMGSPMGM